MQVFDNEVFSCRNFIAYATKFYFSFRGFLLSVTKFFCSFRSFHLSSTKFFSPVKCFLQCSMWFFASFRSFLLSFSRISPVASFASQGPDQPEASLPCNPNINGCDFLLLRQSLSAPPSLELSAVQAPSAVKCLRCSFHDSFTNGVPFFGGCLFENTSSSSSVGRFEWFRYASSFFFFGGCFTTYSTPSSFFGRFAHFSKYASSSLLSSHGTRAALRASKRPRSTCPVFCTQVGAGSHFCMCEVFPGDGMSFSVSIRAERGSCTSVAAVPECEIYRTSGTSE